ncbi:MAG: hypothetical protein INF41_02755 [Rhodospirillaceae bacterium]|jgi:RimJ/RimL family protein N-acetyltransferase|nr:hypothetical protein [Rhodospirillaceae bacterium]
MSSWPDTSGLGWDRFRVAFVKTEADLRAMHAVDDAFYDPDFFDYELKLRWWKAYRYCFLVVLDGEKIVGNLSIHPVQDHDIAEVLADRRETRDLQSLTLEELQATPCRRWHISNLLILDEYRGAHLQALAFLLAQALNLYAESPYLTYPVTISGRAYSKASQRLMERFGFESLGVETQYGPAFVMQAADKNSLFAKLARVGVDRWLG